MICIPSNYRISVMLVSVLFLMTVTQGCTSSPTTAQVSGTVYDGAEPLKSDRQYTWTVVFGGPNGVQAGGPVGKDGTYSVADVPIGPVQIAIVGSVGGGMFGPGEKPPPPAAAQLAQAKRLERCKDPSKSGLTLTVARGTQQHDIRLTP